MAVNISSFALMKDKLIGKHVPNTSRAQEIFDGTMLGDGCLVHQGDGAYFITGNSDTKKLRSRENIPITELLAFLQRLAETYNVLGMIPGEGYPKIVYIPSKSKGSKPFYGCTFRTRQDAFSSEQYYRWYTGGETRYTGYNNHQRYIADATKIIPANLVLTPLSIAYWFMNDGRSVWTPSTSIDVGFCSYCFDLPGIELLEKQLHGFGLSTGRSYRKVPNKKGAVNIEITIPQESIDSFMDLIRPHVTSPYLFKIKYRGSCPLELHNELVKEKNSRRC